MDLTTKYLGMTLRNPLIVSASPLAEDVANIKKMEDAGAAAVVLHSLFEEQLAKESAELEEALVHGGESFAEATSYFPKASEYRLGPEEYLEHIAAAKKAVDIPIIASLNGSSVGGWIDYAKQIQKAGANALELNIYYIPTDMQLTGAKVEETYVDVVKAVKSAVTMPVAVKLSPFFSNMANMAKRFDDAGANALVLFNRFYQPDIDLEELEVKPDILLSTPFAMRLPLTWVAILHGRIKADLAATSGIHSAEDVLKMLMVGANATMLCSALLRYGIDRVRVIEKAMREWMEKHEYDSVKQMQGSLSQIKCANPADFERAQYMRALAGYKLG